MESTTGFAASTARWKLASGAMTVTARVRIDMPSGASNR